MATLKYIKIDSDILAMDLSSTNKMLLGLVKNFGVKGLRMSNDEIAKLIGTRPDTVSKRLSNSSGLRLF